MKPKLNNAETKKSFLVQSFPSEHIPGHTPLYKKAGTALVRTITSNQDLRKICRREYEFSNLSEFITFYQNVLH